MTTFASTPITGHDSTAVVHVAVGVVSGKHGHVLISRRLEDVHQGGYWEFPGGKIEPGETVGDALVRELREELAIDVTPQHAVLRIPFAYPDRQVLLDVWRVHHVGGMPQAREVAEWRWVYPHELDAYHFPAANRPILQTLSLPNRYAITPPQGTADVLLAGLEASLRAGVRMVQWRHHGSTDAVLARARQQCRRWGARLLLNDESDRVLALGLDGVHLSSRRLRGLSIRPLPADQLVAASCHNCEELDIALARDVDFVVLSPVGRTPSHPGHVPLGWQCFANWIADFPRPVYALGGVGEADLVTALSARAQGVAGIRGLWRNS